MPYFLVEMPNGKYRVKSIHGDYLSKAGLPKEKAIKQMQSVAMSEAKQQNDHNQCTCGQMVDQNDEKKMKKHMKSKEHLEGAGLMDVLNSGMDWVKDKFTKRTSYNNISARTLKQYGEYKVMAITVAKKPIMKVLDKVIDFISIGKWGSLKKKYGFDQMMHLGMIITVKTPDGKLQPIMCEKVDAVTIQPRVTISGHGASHMQAPVQPGMFTLKQLLDKARESVGDKTFFDYDPFRNNCQSFTKYILEACNAWTEKVKEFVFQDVAELSKEMPEFSKKFMKATTDIGQLANKWLGKGKHRGGSFKCNPIEEDEIRITAEVPDEHADRLVSKVLHIPHKNVRTKLKYSKTDKHHVYDYSEYLNGIAGKK